jgi:hypothetical protein
LACYDIAVSGFETDSVVLDMVSGDEYRYRPTDPESIANYMEFVAQELEWAMIAAGGRDLRRLYEAGKSIGELAERGWLLAQLD